MLLHHVPPTPPYLRAGVLRRLKQLGALALKNSAYLLPSGDDFQEDLAWLGRDIESQGGTAWVMRVEFAAGPSDSELEDLFRAMRARDYEELSEAAQGLLARVGAVAKRGGTELEADRRRLLKKVDDVRRLDFFGAPGKEELEDLMTKIEHTLHPREPEAAEVPSLADATGRVWVTRRGLKVDRTASAWLIRRFIDPKATVRFVDPLTYRHTEGEIRFDMFDAEFTHRGGLCTFEVLARASGRTDPALAAIAEIVHDIDLKDNRYERPETEGVRALIDGLLLQTTDDQRRLEEGALLFESLYTRLAAEAGKKNVEPRTSKIKGHGPSPGAKRSPRTRGRKP